jgi:hypothetical protein
LKKKFEGFTGIRHSAQMLGYTARGACSCSTLNLGAGRKEAAWPAIALV